MTDNPSYFESTKSELIRSNFTREQLSDFVIRKEILWESAIASDGEVNKKEVELIRQHESNNPSVGYNRFPKHF